MGRFRAWLRGATGRFSASESGVSAIEFAFIGGPFLMFLGCMFETGILLFSEYTLQAAVQKASREVRTGIAQDSEVTAADFKNKICGTSTGVARFLMTCSKVVVYVSPSSTFTALNSATPAATAIGVAADGTAQATVYNCGQAAQPTTIIATYDYKFAFPFMGTVLGNFTKSDGSKYRRIAGIAVFRNEPFVTAKTCK
ncbi:MAG TPA: pilus assembly protein [Aestuariivirga sp.]|mgnify:CR=1 FL=1|nr:pilus assembly protein [Aestuariivirga sp.]